MVKHHFKHLSLLALASLGLAACSATSTSSPEKTAKNQEVAVSSKETPNKEATSSKEKTDYRIGDTVLIGDVEYVVHSKELANRVGNEYFGEDANGQYVIVSITVKNNGKKVISLSDKFFKLVKGDVEYEADSGAGIHVKDDSGANLLYSELNPENTATGKVVFDVSPETANDPNLQLQVQTGFWGTEKAMIHLN